MACPYADYAIRHPQATFARPVFVNQQTATWLPALPEAYAAVQSGCARVAELACGEGVAAVQIARVFPGVSVDGFDLDDASIAAARNHAAAAGVATGSASRCRTPAAPPWKAVRPRVHRGRHDVVGPVGVLRTMRAMRGPGGRGGLRRCAVTRSLPGSTASRCSAWTTPSFAFTAWRAER